MTIEERARLSYYQELSPLDEEHGVFVVQHIETGALYLRKTLENYKIDIFNRLKENPVKNMPRIIEAIEDNGKLIVIESYITGETLRQHLDRKGVFPVPEVCSIGIQLCNILSCLHQMDFIHRDIKPENIIYDDSGIIKLLDLGAAKIYKINETRDTELIGTRGYAAPEQYGFGASSALTDIYGVGVLLNELATGRHPSEQLVEDVDLRTIVQQCTQIKAKERFLSANALKAALMNTQSEILFRESNQTIRVDSARPVSMNAQPRSVTPVLSAEPKQTGKWLDTLMNAGSGWRRFLPPGFRSGNVWHMIIAALWYLVTAYNIIMQKSEPFISSEGATINIYQYAAIVIAIPLVFCNYLGILDNVRITKIRQPIVRLLVTWWFFLFIGVVIYLFGELIGKII